MFFKNLSFYFKFYLIFACVVLFFFEISAGILYISIENEHKENILKHYKIDNFNSIKRVYFLNNNSIYKIDNNYIEAAYINNTYYKLNEFENIIKNCYSEVKCINENLISKREILFSIENNNI